MIEFTISLRLATVDRELLFSKKLLSNTLNNQSAFSSLGNEELANKMPSNIILIIQLCESIARTNSSWNKFQSEWISRKRHPLMKFVFMILVLNSLVKSTVNLYKKIQEISSEPSSTGFSFNKRRRSRRRYYSFFVLQGKLRDLKSHVLENYYNFNYNISPSYFRK